MKILFFLMFLSNCLISMQETTSSKDQKEIDIFYLLPKEIWKIIIDYIGDRYRRYPLLLVQHKFYTLHLERLSNIHIGCEINSLKHVTKFKNIQAISIFGRIDDENFKYLSNLTKLEQFSLIYCFGISGNGLKHLSCLKNIKNLRLSEIHLDDENLLHFSSFDFLEKINLRSSFKITSHGLKHISKLTKITHMDLGFCYQLGYNNLFLSCFNKLKYLNLDSCDKISNDDIKQISDLTGLQYVNLSRCYSVTDEGIRHLTNLTNLEILDLSHNSRITDQGVSHIKKNITSLKLEGCALIGLSKYLTQTKNLETSDPPAHR